MRFLSLRLIAAVGLLAPSAAFAQGVHDDPRALGMGGAVRGDPVANSAIIYNPAGMSRLYTYAAEVGYFRKGGTDGNSVGGGFVDSKTQPSLAVGAAYAYEFTDEGSAVEFTGHNARLGFAHAVTPNRFNLGVALHYLHFDRAPIGNLKKLTMDAGAHFSFSPELHVGVTGQNLIKTKDPSTPREAGGGLAYTGEILTGDFDVVFDFDSRDTAKPRYMVGLELLLAETVPLRFGYEHSRVTGDNYVGGGLGFLTTDEMSTGTQFDLAYRQNLDRAELFHFGVALTFFI